MSNKYVEEKIKSRWIKIKRIFLLFCFICYSFIFCQSKKDLNYLVNKYPEIEFHHQISAIIVLNTENCNTCNVPLKTILDNIKNKNFIKWFLIIDNHLTNFALNSFIQKEEIDTGLIKIIRDDLFYKKILSKNNNESVFLLVCNNKIIYRETLYDINLKAIEENVNKHCRCSYSFQKVKLINIYNKDLFETCNYTVNPPYAFFICNSYNNIHSYNLIQNKELNSYTLNHVSEINYLKLCENILSVSSVSNNQNIIKHNNLKYNNLVTPDRALYSDNNNQYIIFSLEYFSDTIFNNKPAIASYQNNFLIKTDTLLNIKDTFYFDINYYILSHSGGVVINDSIFYFLRYSSELKNIVLSEFYLKDKFIVIKKEIPFQHSDKKFTSIPKIKYDLLSNSIYVFFYPKHKSTEILKYYINNQKVENLMYLKNIFVSYTMFYQINEHEYIALANKKNSLKIFKYNRIDKKLIFLSDIPKDFTLDNNMNTFLNQSLNSNSIKPNVLPFYLSNNNILYFYY